MPPQEQALDQAGSEAPGPDPTRHIKRRRDIGMDAAGWLGGELRPGDNSLVELFDGTLLTVNWTEMMEHATNNRAWFGSVVEDPGAAVTLTRVDDYAILDIRSPKIGDYDISGEVGKRGVVREFNSGHINVGCEACRKVAAFGGDPDSGAGKFDEAPMAAADGPNYAVDGKTIDILMVYTAKAREKSGGRSSIVAKAQSAVNGQNNNFNRSKIAHRVRLVQTREVGRVATGNLVTELNWVAGNSTVASARSSAGADLVAFLSDRDDNNFYGFAQQLGSTSGNSGVAFSANYYDTAAGVWPHEMGHNMGCQHNSAGVYSYSSGHYWKDGSTTRGSMMSYTGSRVPYFSNSDVSYSGNKTGTSTRDNARTIDNTGLKVAGYRTSKTLVEPSCSISAGNKTPVEGNHFTLTVSTKNGGPATSTSGKITVTLPSRLTLVSHDGGSSFDTGTKVWSVPSASSGSTAKLVLTVMANPGSAGITLTPKAVLTGIGSSFVDFNLYNNEGSVSVVSRAPDGGGEPPVTDVVTYRETFNNTGTAHVDFPTRGWTWAGSGGVPDVRNGAGVPPEEGGMVNSPTTGAATSTGTVLVGGGRRGLASTTEYFSAQGATVPLNKSTLNHISLFQANAHIQIGLHVALKFGTGASAKWYYHEPFPAQSVAGFDEAERVEIADFSSENWATSITPNRAGVVYDQPLPDDDITEFGVYVTKDDGGSVSARFDNYEIYASLERPPTPFDNWISSIAPEGARGADDDPDSDGISNLLEFALMGKPGDGSDDGLIASRVVDSKVAGEKELELTVAVRVGANFIDGAASVDGISYTVEGSHDLEFPNAAISSTGPFITAPAGSGLPDLTGTDWEYHSFRLARSEGPEEPDEPGDPGEPVNPDDPVDPEEPTDPADPDELDDTIELDTPEDTSGRGFLRLKVTQP